MSYTEFDSEKLERFFKGMYSDKDASYVNEVFSDRRKETELKDFLGRQFDNLPADDDREKNLDHILYKIHYDINNKLYLQKRWTFENIIKSTFRIAGILLLPLIIILILNTTKTKPEAKEMWVEINAPAWTRVQFSLPDGTKGWLNSSSSIRYAGNFISDRNVTLKGEAYFDVFKDKARPFTVSTGDIIVKAVGTSFNIASYDNEKNVEVVLKEGKIIFSDKAMKKSRIMAPNDLITYDKILNDFSTEVVEPHKYLSWTEGKLVFRNDPVDVIARRLERWYNIDVEVQGSFKGSLRLRATFINDGLEEVLGLLKHSLPLDYKIEYGNLSSDDTYSKTKVIILPRTKDHEN
jgi:transmembrane sensor